MTTTTTSTRVDLGLTGIMPLRNAVKLGYPFELALASLMDFCEGNVLVGVCTDSEDDTADRVRALGAKVVDVQWDMTNHQGYGQSEIAKQTQVLVDMVTTPWCLSLQADEVLHTGQKKDLHRELFWARNVSAFGLVRLYFYGGLHQFRDDWSVPCYRLIQPELWEADPYSGGMQFAYLGHADEQSRREVMPGVLMYHYSRVGDPASVAQRVRNLDTFYHDPDKVLAPDEVGTYDFTELRQLDTYRRDATIEVAKDAKLVAFDPASHPPGAVEFFGG